MPELPQTLKTLCCESNNLTCLPELSRTLKTLCCNNNKLTYLSKLPQTLIKLDCHNNNILIFPYFDNFSKIAFNISNNNIKYVDRRYYLIPFCNEQNFKAFNNSNYQYILFPELQIINNIIYQTKFYRFQ